MHVEYSEDLSSLLDAYEDSLQIQKTFFPDNEMTKRYLNRAFGNAYNFDQEDRLPFAIWVLYKND